MRSYVGMQRNLYIYIYIFIKLPVSSFRMLVTRGQKTHFVASSGNAVDSN